MRIMFLTFVIRIFNFVSKLKTGDVQELDAVRRGGASLRSTERNPTLEELVSRITPENLHARTDWGEPVGKEMW